MEQKNYNFDFLLSNDSFDTFYNIYKNDKYILQHNNGEVYVLSMWIKNYKLLEFLIIENHSFFETQIGITQLNEIKRFDMKIYDFIANTINIKKSYQELLNLL